MAVPYNGDLTNIGYGKEYSGTGQVELLLPSADKAYNDKLQKQIREDRSLLENSVAETYNYLVKLFAQYMEIYDSNPENLTSNQVTIVKALNSLKGLREYNKFNPRNNINLQHQIIRNII
jgi:hypothetical protein